MAKEEGGDEEGGDAAKAAKPKPPILKFLFIGLYFLLTGGATGLVFFTFKKDVKKVPTESAQLKTLENEKNTIDAAGENLFPLETFFINLKGRTGRDYLKATLQLEVFDRAVIPELTQKLPIIRDIVIQTLSEKQRAELMSVQDKLFLKAQLTGKINKVLASGSIRGIYLTQFLIQ